MITNDAVLPFVNVFNSVDSRSAFTPIHIFPLQKTKISNDLFKNVALWIPVRRPQAPVLSILHCLAGSYGLGKSVFFTHIIFYIFNFPTCKLEF